MLVKRKDCNQELLEALENDGFIIKFGEPGKYVNEKTKKKVYKTYSGGIFKEEGKFPEGEYGSWRHKTKEALIIATIRGLQQFKSESIIIREISIAEEEVQIKEEINIVEDYDTPNWTIEYKDFKCVIVKEVFADDKHFDFLGEALEIKGVPKEKQWEIKLKFYNRLNGIEKPKTETMYHSYVRLWSKLFEEKE